MWDDLNRTFVATASGNFADIAGTTGPNVVAGWYVSETNNSTAGAQLIDGYVAAPGAATATLVATATGSLSDGAYLYKITYVTSSGETDVGTASASVTSDSSHRTINLTAIPTFSGSNANAASRVTARKIYRTAAGGSTYKLVTTLADNTTTTYSDTLADGSLGATGPSSNTSGQVIAQWDLAAKERNSLPVQFAAQNSGIPLRLTVTSGAIRVTLFGR